MIYMFRCTNNNCRLVFNIEDTVENYTKKKYTCPKCRQSKLKRIYEDTPIIFKGEGFTKSNIGGNDE